MWLTVEELSQYLKISTAKAYQLVRDKRLPFHNNHGFLRFHKEEIDNWMKTPEKQPLGSGANADVSKDIIFYRGKNVLGFKLTASKIIIGVSAWNRLPAFIEEFINRAKKAGGFLRRVDVLELVKNANDYLRLSYQLGLIDKRILSGKAKEYFPAEILNKFISYKDGSNLSEIICDSIILLAKDKKESTPDERHCLYLLWYYLSLLNEGCSIDDSYFITKEKDEHNYYPMIRHSFIKSCYEFLFGNDMQKAMIFYGKWAQTI
jgi:excisionase family DNA binding protein